MLYTSILPASPTIQEAFDWICDLAYQAGWELWDPISGTEKVYRTNGENSDFPYLYAHFKTYAYGTQITAYLFWDKQAHSGVCPQYVYGVRGHRFATAHINCGTANGDLLCVFANVDEIGDMNYGHFGTVIGHVKKYVGHYDARIRIVEAVQSGTARTVAVESVPDDARVGVQYQLVGALGEGRWMTTLTDIPDGTHITISDVPVSLSIDAVGDCYPFIGDYPHRCGGNHSTNYGYFYPVCPIGFTGIDQITVSGQCWLIEYAEWGASAAHPSGLYIPSPFLVIGYGFTQPERLVRIGWFDPDIISQLTGRTNGDMFAEETIDGGLATSGSAVTIADTSKSWGINVHANKILLLTSGQGAGQSRRISSNTASALTVAEAFSPAPSVGTGYLIAEKARRYWQFNKTLLRECIY